MDMDALLNELQTGMQRRILALPERIRPFTTSFTSLPRAISLTGPRGVGKTVFLLHHAKGKKILYISADSPLLAGLKLYAVIKQAFLAGYEGVIVDEVHFAKDWSISLKAIYDEYPDRILWISDSSSLILRSGTADLSRRFLQISMPLLSFREFLFLEYGTLYNPISPFSYTSTHISSLEIQPEPKLLEAWQKYKQQGTRPFYSEGNFSERLIAIMEKSLYYDIPFLVPSITDNNLRLMSSVISTLAQSVIPRLHVSSLCTDWGIGSDKLYQLIGAMEAVGLLRVIRYEQDKKAKTAGAKLFLADPALYMALGSNRAY
ncbi:ATP-binding protein [Gracilinema caldarium]|uniref:ATP-binding protein n=1 Tax=Gracilinema caldarium TaxID=215591 RepID=UPI00068B1D5B|nr:AAA family ATPase [Gracilinema caldarium]